jgi:protoheme IX farnesyltransferase
MHYFKLTKFHVNLVVALTSVLGYMMGIPNRLFNWKEVLALLVGGLLITATAHIINQIIEVEYDALMERTRKRPLVTGEINRAHAIALAIVLSVSGLLLLYFSVHPFSAYISFVSLVMYAFIYTPMKRISRIAIPIGAIPGALPVLIGYVGATGRIDAFVLTLFLFQVLWQFPHFWAVAWIWDASYKAAGYDLMPTPTGKSRLNAFITFLSVFTLYPVLYMLFHFGYVSSSIFVVFVVLTILFHFQAYLFYKKKTDEAAKILLKSSVIYLPLIQIIIAINIINQ